MRTCLLILLLAVNFASTGCQSITAPMTQSLNRAAEDYHRVTTGSASRYIAARGQQP
jgi:hypothetical protein